MSSQFNFVKRNHIQTEENKTGTKCSPLNSVELGVINLFVQLSRALGQPASVAEIYGLLFVSPRPLPQDEFIGRLNLSKGSASQGLRYLLNLGAARTVSVGGDRRTHYEAVAELRNLASRFLQQQILPNFENSDESLETIAAAAQELAGEQRNHAIARIKLLRSWERNSRRIFPVAIVLLGGRKGKSVV